MKPFYKKLDEYYVEKPAKKPFNKEQMNTVIEEILIAKEKVKTKTRREYFLLNTYDVIEIPDGETKALVKDSKNEFAGFVCIVSYEEIYEKLLEVHVSTGHGSRDKMLHALENMYQIPRPCIEIFLTLCETCQKKKSKGSSRNTVKLAITNEFMCRGYVDLIDFQSIPDGDFKWLLNFQDHATKFLCLKPLKTNTAKEVATEILKIFLTFGTPQVLQSNNGSEFCNLVIRELKTLWPQIYLVNGRPRLNQRLNQEVENALRAWMIENKSTSWSLGSGFVQWQTNNSLNRIIGRSPYKAVFGGLPKVRLESSNLPSHIIPSLKTEQEVEEAHLRSKEECTVESLIEASSSNSYSQV